MESSKESSREVKESSKEEEERAIDALISHLLQKKKALVNSVLSSSSMQSEEGGRVHIEELIADKDANMRKDLKEEGVQTHESSSSDSYTAVVRRTAAVPGERKLSSKVVGTESRGQKQQDSVYRGNQGRINEGRWRDINRGKEKVGGKSDDTAISVHNRSPQKEEGEISHRQGAVQRGGEKRKEPHGEWAVIKRKKSPSRGYHHHSQDLSEVQCFNCAELGHTRYSCRNPPKCFKCKRSGHTAPFCQLHVREGEQVGGQNTGDRGGEQRVSLKRCMVRFTKSMEQEEQRLMKSTLVATVTKGRPSEKDMVEEFKRRWPSLQGWMWSIRRLSATSFLIPFPHEGKIQEVVSKGELEFEGFVLNFRRWTMKIGAWKRDLLHRWIVISKLPVCCWEWNGFDDIVREFGWLIEVDPRSTPRSRSEKARVKVGVFNEQDIPKGIIVEIKGESYELELEIEGSRSAVKLTTSEREFLGEEGGGKRKEVGPKRKPR